MMKLYVLERADAEWDEHIGFVVAAYTRSEARKLARGACYSNEDDGAWMDAERTTLREIGSANVRVERGIVLRAFKAG